MPRRRSRPLSLEIPSSANLGVDPLDALAARIRNKDATVAVLGLGYVGLPLLVTISNAGFPTLGLDADPQEIGGVKGGPPHIVGITDSHVASPHHNQKDN